MPLVRRKIKIVNDTTTMSEDIVDHMTYVPKSEVRRTDKIVDPASEDGRGRVSERMLAELASMYPDEFKAAAEARGITGFAAGVSGRLAQMLTMKAKELISAIRATDKEKDSDLLWQVYEHEMLREDDARSTVLEALEEKSVGENVDLGDEDDDTDPAA